jgi:hypothetical protein
VTDGPGLVIFDCDGVLVDSEPLAARVDAEMLGELGWAISVEEVAERFIGRSSDDVRSVVESHLGRALPEGWEAEYRRRFFQVAADELTPVAGVTDVVDRLIDAGIPVCVGSNSSRERVTWSLQVASSVAKRLPAPSRRPTCLSLRRLPWAWALRRPSWWRTATSAPRPLDGPVWPRSATPGV